MTTNTSVTLDDFEKISWYICENCRFSRDDGECWENPYVCPVTSEFDEIAKLCDELNEYIDKAYKEVS